MNKKQKILTVVGLSLAALLLAGVMPSFAAEQADTPTITSENPAGTLINNISRGALNGIFLFINNIIGFIGSILFNLAGGLTNFALLLNFDILNNPMITVGWGISRDLANLGFVLFIIIIAIATILRMQEYGAKSTLGKLIAVALLVNFSLVFAGVFIDFSNMLTNYFIKSITTDNGNLGTSLANAFQIQSLLKVKDVGKMASLMQGAGNMEIGIASSFFVAAFTLIGAFSLLTLAIMFLIRYIALSILLVLVPLAFLFIILPTTKNLWDKWSKEFMEWIIFAPAASFFLYLAVYMTINYGKMIDNLATSSQGIGTANQMNFQNLIINEPLQIIGRMVIVIGLLCGGLIIAKSTGAMGAKAGFALAQEARNRIQGFVGRKGQQGLSYLARTKQGQKYTEKMLRTPGLRTIGMGISNFGLGTGEKLMAEATAKQKDISISRLLKILPALTGIDLMAATARIAKEGQLKYVDQKFLNNKILTKQTKNAFKRYNMEHLFEDYIGKALGLGKNLEVKEAIDAGNIKEAYKLSQQSFMGYDQSDFNRFKKYANSIYKDFSNRKFDLGKDEDSYNKTQNIISYGFTSANPGNISKNMSQLDPGNFDRYVKSVVDSQIPNLETWDKKDRTLEKEMEWLGKLKDSTKKEDKLKYQIHQTINKAMDKRMLGELYEFGGMTET